MTLLAQVSVPQAGSQEDEVEEVEEVEEVPEDQAESNKSKELTAPGCNGTAMRLGHTWEISIILAQC